MDWIALNRDPLWHQFWSEKLIVDRINAVQGQLLMGSESDPHTIGKLRGQLEMLGWLQHTVINMAKAQEEADAQPKPQSREEKVNWLRRLQVR